MLTRLGIAFSVVLLAAVSGYANYLHVQDFGPTVIGMVLAAEAIKFAAPLAMRYHANNGDSTSFCATLLLWLLVLFFSLTNSFGNGLSQQSQQQARLDAAKASEVRPVHVVMREKAALPACEKVKQGKKYVENCPSNRKDIIAALDKEIALATKGNVQTVTVHKSNDAIRDGMVMLASFAGKDLDRERLFVYVALLWTLLSEFGSALGALAIPGRKK